MTEGIMSDTPITIPGLTKSNKLNNQGAKNEDTTPKIAM
jgi:hypothetical protein